MSKNYLRIKKQKLSSRVVAVLLCFVDILRMSNLDVLPELMIEPVIQPMRDLVFQWEIFLLTRVIVFFFPTDVIMFHQMDN